MDVNKQWFINKINQFLENDECNRLNKLDRSLIFEPDVLVGIADGNDDIYTRYKSIIGDFYLSPSEAYEWYCKKNNIKFSDKNLSVVAYILPINHKTKMENLNYSKTMPSERWAHTRLFGEEANMNIQVFLVEELKKLGINAFAPTLDKNLFKINRKIWASNWSHRHNCFAAGLGSFGLSDGFINAQGKAMRCGSIIIDLKLPNNGSDRPQDPYEFCIKCGDCISRCPVNAISFENRHNKMICATHVTGTIPFINQTYGINIFACGLCQVGVSCSDGIPKK
ncbi:MAG: 4Fe-4S binding protein [Candidatus Heimdallarchaeota archaeon]